MKKKYRFIDTPDGTPISVPKSLSPEEEVEVLQCYQEFLKDHPGSINLEARCTELFRQSELGQLISMRQFLEEIEKDDQENSGDIHGNTSLPH